MYEYAVKLVRVVDGDTVELDVDLGFTVRVTVMFRLFGINAPEVKGTSKEFGLASKQALINILNEGSLTVKSEKAIKTDKYGRWLAAITVTRSDGSTVNVSDWMILSGFAVPYLP